MTVINQPFPKSRTTKSGVKKHGHIERSEQWLVGRIALLHQKLSDFESRIENTKEEIASREKELATLKE